MATINSLPGNKKIRLGRGRKKVPLKLIDFDIVDKPVRKARKIFEVCPDCRKKYQLNSNLSRHKEICSARTCEECWETYPDTIIPNSDGKRICACCWRDKRQKF